MLPLTMVGFLYATWKLDNIQIRRLSKEAAGTYDYPFGTADSFTL